MYSRSKPMNSTTAVAYIRVSTEEQENGPEAQRAAIATWAARQGIHIASWHVDQGISGASPIDERPALLEALGALETHRAGVLVAAKRDRVARDVMVAALVERATERLGAVLRTADGASDNTSPEGVMLKGMLDLFAQYERAIIRARTKAGMVAKKARGEAIGEPPMGCKNVDGRLVPCPVEGAILALVRTLRAEGHTIKAITTRLAAEGLISPRSGRAYGATQVGRMAA